MLKLSLSHMKYWKVLFLTTRLGKNLPWKISSYLIKLSDPFMHAYTWSDMEHNYKPCTHDHLKFSLYSSFFVPNIYYDKCNKLVMFLIFFLQVTGIMKHNLELVDSRGVKLNVMEDKTGINLHMYVLSLYFVSYLPW